MINGVATYPQRSYAASTTTPFRVRGTQIRVMNQGQPAANAIVYRLRSDQTVGGQALAASEPYRTDEQGFLRGRGDLTIGDRLLALVPISSTTSYTMYYTNGLPTPIGVDAFTVDAAGVQTINVSPQYPLTLFNLLVTLEWDATATPSYLEQLEFDLQRASEHLYDFTNGQVALGTIQVVQNGEEWAYANVVVHATNRMRPYATQGGIVELPTTDPQHPDIEYQPGQVHMGANWNRYGIPGQNLGDDWALTLGHELSHYLLFQEDAYLGLDAQGYLQAVSTCTGSVMGDYYSDPNATEFIYDTAHWNLHCGDTLANQTLQRTEWQTIKLWYPHAQIPTAINGGPNLAPFDFTTVEIYEPFTATNTLSDPTFYLDYSQNQVSSNEARAYLLRSNKYAIDLGSPVGGQNRVLARGAQIGDRLCIFDRQQSEFGCETITAGDDRLRLRRDPAWNPIIQLTPITTRTFNLQVAGIAPNLNMQARLFPELGEATAAITLSSITDGYSGTFQLLDPTLTGVVQLWVNEPTTPRRETIAAYSIGGNMGNTRVGSANSRVGSANSRVGSANSRVGSANSRVGSAPIVSPDGQMILFTPNPVQFDEGEFYSIQAMAGLPPIPSGKTIVGQGYRLLASAGAPIIEGSVSFQYLSNEVLIAGVSEESLTVHYWNGTLWQAIPTTRNTYFNLVAARNQGPGVYALMGGITKPQITNMTPQRSTNNVQTLITLQDSGFVPTLVVTMTNGTQTYQLPVTNISPTSITVAITAGLQPDEYMFHVTNGDGGHTAIATPFALFEPDSARFYDFFSSGTSQWTLSGDWNVVQLPNGERAITDSPLGNYASATGTNQRRITSATSQPISMLGMISPTLQFRHDYIIANLNSSRDEGRVEISSDNGATWTTLKAYSGGGVFGAARPIMSDEWSNVQWKPETLDLSGYAGTIRLRFVLDVDQTVADKGWIIDNVRVTSEQTTAIKTVFIPLVTR